jgi:hypothetical protein
VHPPCITVTCYQSWLLKLPEHTFGTRGPRDTTAWSNPAFASLATADPDGSFALATRSYNLQRWFLHAAVDALNATSRSRASETLQSLHRIASECLEDAFPPPEGELVPASHNMVAVQHIPSKGMINLTCLPDSTTSMMSVGFDVLTGAIHQLTAVGKGYQSWAQPSAPLALFSYRTYSQADGDDWIQFYRPNYFKPGTTPANRDHGDAFYKPNISQSGARHAVVHGRLAALWKAADGTCNFTLRLDMPAELHETAGAPRVAWLHAGVMADPHAGSVMLDLDLWMYGKSATRLPEAMFLEFWPKGITKMDFEKIGGWVDATSVVQNGSQFQHAVWNSVRMVDPRRLWTLSTVDAAVAAVNVNPEDTSGGGSGPTAFPAHATIGMRPLTQTETSRGASLLLFSNAYNTNYPLWYPFAVGEQEASARFRSTLTMKTQLQQKGDDENGMQSGAPIRFDNHSWRFYGTGSLPSNYHGQLHLNNSRACSWSQSSIDITARVLGMSPAGTVAGNRGHEDCLAFFKETAFDDVTVSFEFMCDDTFASAGLVVAATSASDFYVLDFPYGVSRQPLRIYLC